MRRSRSAGASHRASWSPETVSHYLLMSVPRSAPVAQPLPEPPPLGRASPGLVRARLHPFAVIFPTSRRHQGKGRHGLAIYRRKSSIGRPRHHLKSAWRRIVLQAKLVHSKVGRRSASRGVSRGPSPGGRGPECGLRQFAQASMAKGSWRRSADPCGKLRRFRSR
jgi:hypothetical protein